MMLSMVTSIAAWSETISFTDAKVKAKCVANWDTDSDGELSKAEAAVVKDLGYVFTAIQDITSFNELQYFTGLEYIGSEAFHGCRGLTSIIIPNSVKSIADEAFSSCTELTSLIIPNSVTYIGKKAFLYCYGLTSLTIGNNVKEIANSAFSMCTGLTSVIIPKSVTTIGEWAFVGCTGLTSFYVEEGNSTYDSRDNCNAIIETSTNTLLEGFNCSTIPSSVTAIGKAAFENYRSLTSVTIPKGVTSIGEKAFYLCTALTSVTVENSTPVMIDKDCFTNRTNATLYVPAGSKAAYEAAEYWKEFKEIVEMSTPAGNITFADDNVKALCVANWDTNSDGELSEAEAAAVTDLGEVFKKKTTITSFKELQYFTGLTCIGHHTFWNCSNLTSVIIPDNVKTIDYYAFLNCSSLKTVNIPSGVTTIGYSAFQGCAALTSADIFANVKTLESSTFQGCTSLSSVTLPNTLETIGNGAFKNCSSLTSIAIPPSVKTIEDYAFEGCSSLASVHISDLEAWCNISFSAGGNPLLYAHHLYLGDDEIIALSIPSSVTSIKSFTFQGGSGFTSLIIHDQVESIANSAFTGCSGLTSVEIPGSVETIGMYVFKDCTGLTSVTIPNSVTAISMYAFYNCTSLASITLHSDIQYIQNQAFVKCNNLTSVTVQRETPVDITPDVFSNCSNATLYVPAGCKAAYEAADYWKDFKEIVEGTPSPIITFADANVKAICVANWDTNEDGELSEAEAAAVTSKDWPQKAFKGNTLITSFDELQYFTGLSEIPYGAFSECYNLTTIVIPDNVKSISPLAFEGCSNLSTIIIPDAVTTIHTDAFADSKWLNDQPSGMVYAGKVAYTFKGDMPANTEIVLDEGTLGIADYAFQDFSGLSSITIPNSVTEIGQSAFNGCSNLTSVIIPGKVTSIAQRAFFGCSGLTSITIPNSVTSIENAAFYGCSGLVSVAIPDGVTSIGYEAFLGCSSLGSLSLPGGVKTIGNRAFSMCSNLTSVYVYWQTPLSLSTNIFLDSQGGTLYVPAGSKAAYETADYWKDFGEIYEIFSAPIQLNDGTVDAQFRIIDENAKTVETFGTYGLGPAIEKATEGSITIPAEVNGYQVVGIGSWSFYSCKKITQVNLPGTLTYIGESAFRICYQLQEVNIPEGVTSIGLYAFKSCIFSSLTLPSSLQTIEEVAFEGCNELTSVTMSGSTPPTIGEYTFNINNPSNVTIYVPLGSLVAYQAADYWKNFNIVELDNRDYLLNGDMEGNDVSCFYLKEPDDTDPVPSTIVDGVGKDGSRCIVVNSADNPANIWDTQFYVRLTKPLPAGTRYHLKFDYKASQEAEVHTQSQQEPGGYLAMNLLNNLYFTEEWQTYDEYGVISDSQSPADKMQTIAFDLAVSESATTYYFDNFFFEIDNTPLSTVTERPEGKTLTYTGEAQELAIAGTCENGTMLYSLDGDTFSEEIPTATEAGQYFIYYKVSANEGYADSETYAVRTIILPKEMANIIINSSMEGDDTSCFFFSQKTDNSEEENPAEQSTIVDGVGVDGSRGIVVQSSDNAEHDWDTQFFVRLPYSLPAGTLYRLKFDYKASQEARGHSEMHEQPRTYLWEGFGDQYFITEWQSYETVGMISDNQSPEGNMQTIAFDLNISREAIDYYFDNVTFEVDGNLSIPFADAQVKELCVANWDTNSDGELSVSEAAAVTNEQFADLSFESVTAESWTFDELQYFTGLTVLNTKLAETKISSVKIPVTVTEIGENAFRKTMLSSITLPDAVKKVGEGAFAECGELVTANLGRVEEIGVTAFISTSIVNLTLPGTVKTVGIEPFSWNWTMKQATLEEGVTKVPDTMFHGNVNLTTVSLPSTLTTIEPRAFQQCEALTTISIPESVTTIAEQAFNKCTSLVEVTVANPTPVAITEEVFSNRKNATLYVPDGCVAAYRAAEYWKEFKRILVVRTSDPVNETDISQMPNAIYMEPITGRVGRKFWAELKLKNEYDIRAYQFDIELPVGVTIATDEDGKYIYEQGGRHEDVEPVLNYNEASSTYYMRVIDDVAAGDGVIWKLNLKVAEGLALGDYPVVFTNVKYTPADGQDTQDIPDVTCRLMIEEHGYLKGDANDDDIVNIADVVCIVNHSAHFDTPIFVETSADVTGNGKADLTDAVKIIDYIIGRIDDLTNAPAMARAFKAPAMAPTLRAQSIAPASGLSVEKVSMAYASDVSILENAIYADNLTVKSGQTCPLTIFLKNAKQTNGYQFQLVLPEGVTIPKDDKGKYACELSSRHQGHKVEINYKNGAYKVLVYSQSSEALTGNDGEICTIQLQVADNMANGDYTLTIKEAAYSLISGASWVSLPKADIRLSNFVKGDANGNGYVDIDDAVCIVDHIVGKSTPGFIEAAADVNNDNIVDIADAVAIVNFITGKSSALSQ